VKFVIRFRPTLRAEVLGYLGRGDSMVANETDAKRFDLVVDAAVEMARPAFDKLLGDNAAEIAEAA